ncbi:MAG: hypothetical protein IJZ68_06315 [Bacteroidaceae bacterium]|nr:hypothetical protein [Bacteroidaceae bacterium]
MTKHQFVDKFRGKDDRDQNPHLKRIIPQANTGDVMYCVLYIIGIIMMIIGFYFCVVGVALQKYVWLWFGLMMPAGVACILLCHSMIGDAKFEHVPIPEDELRKYTGKFVFIHWLNNITGYEDEWVPFYGPTEEFVRFHNNRPEVCVAPFEQYKRGWVAYAHKLTKTEITEGRTHS